MNVECQHCHGEFLAVFTTDAVKKTPHALDTTLCPFCQCKTRVVYDADNRPPAREFMHSGEIITTRTPGAYEWWRHNKEFFAVLRYRPRRTRA
jgi:hypothetical protein